MYRTIRPQSSTVPCRLAYRVNRSYRFGWLLQTGSVHDDTTTTMQLVKDNVETIRSVNRYQVHDDDDDDTATTDTATTTVRRPLSSITDTATTTLRRPLSSTVVNTSPHPPFIIGFDYRVHRWLHSGTSTDGEKKLLSTDGEKKLLFRSMYHGDADDTINDSTLLVRSVHDNGDVEDVVDAGEVTLVENTRRVPASCDFLKTRGSHFVLPRRCAIAQN
jgi:hypothetical protein